MTSCRSQKARRQSRRVASPLPRIIAHACAIGRNCCRHGLHQRKMDVAGCNISDGATDGDGPLAHASQLTINFRTRNIKSSPSFLTVAPHCRVTAFCLHLPKKRIICESSPSLLLPSCNPHNSSLSRLRRKRPMPPQTA